MSDPADSDDQLADVPIDIVLLARMAEVSREKMAEHRLALERAIADYKGRWHVEDAETTRKLRRLLKELNENCRKVLDILDVKTTEAAEDGPGSGASAIAQALDTVIETETLRQAVRTIGTAAQQAGGYLKAPTQQEIDSADCHRTDAGAADASPYIRLAVRGTLAGHGPDLALEAFVNDVLRIYEVVTGKRPTVTHGHASRGGDKGVAGRCLDFVQTAVKLAGASMPPGMLDRLVREGKRKRISRS